MSFLAKAPFLFPGVISEAFSSVDGSRPRGRIEFGRETEKAL
jgi:hypothetical protein